MDIFRVTPLNPHDSQLPVTIYLRIRSLNSKRKAIIMVSNNCDVGFSNDHFALSVADHPEIVGGACKLRPCELEVVKNWIILNTEPLIDYWNEKETSTLRLLNKLKNL